MNKIVWLIALVIVASLTLFTIRVWIVSDLLSPTRDPASARISTFSQERETKLPVAVASGLPAKHNNDDPGIKQIILSLPKAAQTKLSDGNDIQGNLDGSNWRIVTVQSGDNLSSIFSRLELKAEDLYLLNSAGNEVRTALERLYPGQVIRIRTNKAGGLLELVYEIDQTQGIRVVREGSVFEAHKYTQQIDKHTAFGLGTISGSFYQSALEAGMSDKVIMQLVEMFRWDIDFALDIRAGDSFAVVYEEEFLDGEKVGDGGVLAAQFTIQGKTYRAVRYTDAEGNMRYYTPQGRSLRQAFLRSPVDFRRISSRFQLNRRHPVLGIQRSHKGVDYAASTGTPIKAAGDAQVRFIGRRGGYGNTIILQHSKHYSTLYAHLSRFKPGLQRGSRVKQGDIIGYVGQTGLVTGPHLHYELRMNGTPVNPITVRLPGVGPMDPGDLPDFRKQATALMAQLDNYTRISLAVNAMELGSKTTERF